MLIANVLINISMQIYSHFSEFIIPLLTISVIDAVQLHSSNLSRKSVAKGIEGSALGRTTNSAL